MHFIFCRTNNEEKESYTPYAFSSANFVINYYLIPTIKDRTKFFLVAKAYSPINKEYFYFLDKTYESSEEIGKDLNYFSPSPLFFNKIKTKYQLQFIIFNGIKEIDITLQVVSYLIKNMKDKEFSKDDENELIEISKINKLCNRLSLNESEFGQRLFKQNFKFFDKYNIILKRSE